MDLLKFFQMYVDIITFIGQLFGKVFITSLVASTLNASWRARFINEHIYVVGNRIKYLIAYKKHKKRI